MKEPAGKKKAVLAHYTFIGMFIAMSMNSEKTDGFASLHIRNMFGLFVIFICSQVLVAYVNTIVGDIVWLLSILLWGYSFIVVRQNKPPSIPILSNFFTKWFTFLS